MEYQRKKNLSLSCEKAELEYYFSVYRQWGNFVSEWWRRPEIGRDKLFRGRKRILDSALYPFMEDWKIVYSAMGDSLQKIPFPCKALEEHVFSMTRGVHACIDYYSKWMHGIEEAGVHSLPNSFSNDSAMKATPQQYNPTQQEAHAKIAHDIMDITHIFMRKERFCYAKKISNCIGEYIGDLSVRNKQARLSIQLITISYTVFIHHWNDNFLNNYLNLGSFLDDSMLSLQRFREVLKRYIQVSQENVNLLLASLKDLLENERKGVQVCIDWGNAYFRLLDRITEIPFNMIEEIQHVNNEFYLAGDNIAIHNESKGHESCKLIWDKFAEDSALHILEKSQFFHALPSFTNALTEYIQATIKVAEHLHVYIGPNASTELPVQESGKELLSTHQRKGLSIEQEKRAV